MENRILYKYLDADGGLKMLQNSNLRFSNATKLNDPFDCHPSLIDCSKIPTYISEKWSPEIISKFYSRFFSLTYQDAWICSLSQIYDALLMWSYYSNHKGICVGLDIWKTKECLSKFHRVSKTMKEIEVEYIESLHKADYFQDKDKIDFLRYQIGTKAKVWEHEQEVRLYIRESSRGTISRNWKINPLYFHLDGECFTSIYLGIRMEEEVKNKIIDVSYKLNPAIKIYQMSIDADAYKLNPNKII